MNNPGFQVSLDVRGRLCVVIGGEEEAADKVNRLLDAGGKVYVINPTLHADLKKLTASGKIIHRGRNFRSTDTQGAFFVLNTVRGNMELARELYALAKTERFLLWSVDRPDLSTCMMPALVRRGDLRIAISTSGASPALAKLLREQCEELFDDRFSEFLSWLGSLRETVQKEEPDEKARRERLAAAIDGFRLHGRLEFPSEWSDHREQSQSTVGQEG